jgi:acyl dehydratase
MSLLEQLQDRVGSEIGVGDWTTVTQDQIDKFADATLDHQWIHVDTDRAKEGPFGTTIAHGFLTLSLISGIAPFLEVGDVEMALNYGLDRVRFITPVPCGSRLRARSELAEVREVSGGVQVKELVTVELEGSEKPACVAERLTRFYL